MENNDYNLHIHLTEREYQEMQKQRDFLGYKTNAQLIRSFIHTAAQTARGYAAKAS